MSKTLRLNNRHAFHPTACDLCGRKLPRRAYRTRCATCRKSASKRTYWCTQHRRWEPYPVRPESEATA